MTVTRVVTQLMEGYQNGLPGQAAVECVSEVYRHVSGNVIILLLDVAGNPVAVAWLLSKRRGVWSAQKVLSDLAGAVFVSNLKVVTAIQQIIRDLFT